MAATLSAQVSRSKGLAVRLVKLFHEPYHAGIIECFHEQRDSLLESIAEVKDRQVAKTGKSSVVCRLVIDGEILSCARGRMISPYAELIPVCAVRNARCNWAKVWCTV